MMPGCWLSLGNGTAKALGSPDSAFSISESSETKPEPHTRWVCMKAGPCSLLL